MNNIKDLLDISVFPMSDFIERMEQAIDGSLMQDDYDKERIYLTICRMTVFKDLITDEEISQYLTNDIILQSVKTKYSLIFKQPITGEEALTKLLTFDEN